MQYLGVTSKMTKWSSFLSKEHGFNNLVIQYYAPIMDPEEVEAGQCYEDLQHLELTSKKMSFLS